MKTTGKKYDSVLDMVKDISDDPDFVAAFERRIKVKQAVKELVDALSPSERLYVFMGYCPYCGESRSGDWAGKPYCEQCIQIYEENERKFAEHMAELEDKCQS